MVRPLCGERDEKLVDSLTCYLSTLGLTAGGIFENSSGSSDRGVNRASKTAPLK